MGNNEEEFEYKEALMDFYNCFVLESWGPKGVDIQESNRYKRFMKESGNKGIRGASDFGIKVIRRAMYANNGQYENGVRRYLGFKNFIVLEPTMLVDPSVKLEYGKHYSREIDITGADINVKRQTFEDEDNVGLVNTVKKLLKMTNEEIMQEFGVSYPFLPETKEKLDEKDREIIMKRTKDSLIKGLELSEQTAKRDKSHVE